MVEGPRHLTNVRCDRARKLTAAWAGVKVLGSDTVELNDLRTSWRNVKLKGDFTVSTDEVHAPLTVRRPRPIDAFDRRCQGLKLRTGLQHISNLSRGTLVFTKSCLTPRRESDQTSFMRSTFIHCLPRHVPTYEQHQAGVQVFFSGLRA